MHGDDGYGSVAMGEVTFTATLPGSLGVANVGNPHVVVRDDASWDEAPREAHRRGARRKRRRRQRRIRHGARPGPGCAIRVIERGVGWTLACGTGSVATAAVLHREGLVGFRGHASRTRVAT